MTAYGYIRRSVGDDDTQRYLLRQSGISDEHIYADHNTSGSLPPHRRQAWPELNSRLVAGDSVTVRELARISRRRLQHTEVMYDWHYRGVAVISLQDGEAAMLRYLNAGDEADGMARAFAEAFLVIYGAIAEQEWIATRERIMQGQARARAEGKRIGRPAVDDDIISLIRLLAAQGMSNAGIARRVGVAKATVAKYRRDAQAGQSAHPGKIA